MNDSRTGAIILATPDTGFGAPSSPDGQPSSLQQVNGECLASYVVRGCQAAASIGQVILVADADAAGAPFGADAHVESAGLPAEDIQRALTALNDCSAAVVLPGDVAFVTGDEIDAFIAAATARQAQMAYPMLPRGVCEATFPELRRTYFRLREGELTGGNALFLDVPTFLDNGQILVEAMELRNEPWKLALAVNPLVLLSYRSGGLSLGQIEGAAQEILGISSAAVIVEAPGLATDIHSPIDLRVARERLGEA